MKRKCAICKQDATRLTVTMRGWCGGVECGVELGKREAMKERKRVSSIERKAEKKERKEHRERKKKLKPRKKWLAEAQDAFNAFIRARDAGKPCISCGTMHTAQWDAGHYRSVGAAGHLRFNEDNCHRQCSRPCNKDLSGNLIAYRRGLVARIGSERVDALETDNGILRLRIDDIKAIKAHYEAKRKEIERGNNDGR